MKSGLKLVQMETDVAMHTYKLLLRKKLNIVISLVNFCEIKYVPKRGLISP